MMRGVLLCFVLVTGGLIFLLPTSGQAIPAFARRESVTCQMCHFRLPELNEDGHAYIRRGLREDPGGMGAMPGMSMSSDMQMEMPAPTPPPPATATPRALGTPLSLEWGKYLSVIGDHAITRTEEEGWTFEAGGIDLWVAGPFDTHWSAAVNASFDIDEGGSEIEQGYGQYITRWDTRFHSVRFGQVLPFAILVNQGGPSMPLSTPLILEAPTLSGWSPTTLTRGVEIGTVDLSRWNAYFGVGQPHLEDELERHTDIYASADYLFTPAGDSLTAYGYWGKATLAPGDEDRPFHRVGFFGNIYFTYVKGVAGYLTGREETSDGTKLDTSGYFLLLERLLSDRWAAYARYDRVRQEQFAAATATQHGPTIGASWWAATQVRLTAEAQFLRGSEGNENTFMLEMLWAF